MPNAASRTRVRVFTAAVVFYLCGVSVAVLTDVPSAMSASIVLVAGAAWAFGIRAGIVALVLELMVGFVLFSTQALTSTVPPITILVPVLITDTVVLTSLAALRRAEFRQGAIEDRLREKNAELETALAEVKELRGMLPICAWCKCVRDVDGMWNRLESYLSKHSHATLTHGVCPTCVSNMTSEVQSLSPTA
ncbi:pas sensor protein : Nitrate/nitrite-specific extracellular solute-binding protein OS=Desulfotignum phosphitoxidans DSM 13687 GN=Dpo_3c00830 PE=4 SV=1 [Gemmata massiliana]|uniref:Pas sensor protein: Nitrate/nitrite-specific extracellular solute-binding protein n=1 Tax=Gemmata massiliana TaxID=1210884 RepID=A0A6P2CUE6_9BACT|nr:hypothetical protein [Gemmata massiliana]VTR90810.1 pas sensor protein : Nitrate/nitrite-specific extracellular solute-binding protein OS=Desulfotignum phosphitoxidans DSM 13687 GN=Dpo_3c00830 PE=4 SV=1 [Gemmata massiliana]